MKKDNIKKLHTSALAFLLSFMFVGVLFGQSTTITIGTATTTTSSTGPTPFGTGYEDDRTQIIYLASELQAAGLTSAHAISLIEFDVSNAKTTLMNNFKIKIKHTTVGDLYSGFEDMTTGTLFFNSQHTAILGWNQFNSITDFNWNGTDNIIVEVSFDNTTNDKNSYIRYTSTPNDLLRSKYSNSLAGPAEFMTGGKTYSKRPNIKITATPILPVVNFPSNVKLNGDASPTYSNNFIHVMNPLTSQDDKYEMIETINYFDGLGKPMQSTSYNASGDLSKDIITPIVYDAFGRQDKDYLAFAAALGGAIHSDPSNVTNYTGYYGTVEDDFVFSEKNFDPSPLNRIKEQGAPGQSWQLDKTADTDKTIKFENRTNGAAEVRLWVVDANGDLTSSGYYLLNELYKSIIKDENWISGTNNTTEEFKDKQGRVVLKRTYGGSVVNGSVVNNAMHDTYYVYDDFGNLTFVIPPKAEGTTSSTISSTVLSELCYQYTYDNRNRLIEKKIPGKGKESIVYDQLDRPVMTQDAMQSGTEWLFTKYGILGRVAYTGIYSSITDTRASLQSSFNGGPAKELYEHKRTTSGTLGIYYDNDNFPSSSIEVLTVNYYDDYTFDLSMLGTIPTVVQGESIITTVVRGLPTGSKVKVLDQSPTQWITTATYYDKNARAIYTTSDNAYLDTQDNVEMKLDFRGKVEKMQTSHTKNTNPAIVTIEDFVYDDMERLLTQKHQIVGQTQETLVSNIYDELGKLITKGVGNIASSGTRLQTVDYAYNIRGWLKQINDVTNIGSDLFAFQLNYNDIADVNKKLYNGNISQSLWRTANTDNSLKDYEYSYDALNRITSGIDNTGNYNLTSVAYDKNGNITALNRKGHINTGATLFGNMDLLVYGYETNSNKLKKVTDTSGKTQGFNDGANQTTEYTYDANGNLLTDANKGITSILYNHLNLPTEIKFDNSNTKKINYTYDAIGVKLKKVVNDGAVLTTTDYAGNFVYENNTLQFFNHAEGYVNNDNGTFKYVYNYLDHLGNIRLSYADLDNNGSINPSTEILQERNNYPFGLEHQGYNNVIVGTENNHKTYNGKELEEELGKNTLAYGWRDYDPAIGRFNKVDRFSEKYYSLSTYSYAGNNPIFFVDVQGDSIASGSSTRRANRNERRAERRADRVDRRADKREAKGQDVTDLRARSSELRKSGQDIRDMRADKNNMYRYASVNGREAKKGGIVGPTTKQTGTTESGLNEITLYTEGNMPSQLHEGRHGGQTARGELGSNYGVADEVSAYRAEYSWNGRLSFLDVTKTPSNAEVLRSLQTGGNPLRTTLFKINSITPTIINNMVDPGFKYIYPPRDPKTGALLIPLNVWNSN